MKFTIRLLISIVVFIALLACQGDVGATGAKGDLGPQGPQGVPGPSGPPGQDGLDGDTGPKGLTGPVGPAGPTGPQGAPGEEGEKGDLVPKGQQGDTGPQGPQGAPGEDGEKGDTGPAGPQGPQGASGEDGEKGDIGPQGEIGPVGPKGLSGSDFHQLFSGGKDVKNHVVWIDAGLAKGSAVVIAEGELLTAEHVISGKSTVQASIPGVGTVTALVQGWDKTRDLALLKYDSDGNESVVQISEGSIWNGDEWTSSGLIGSPVTAIGYVNQVSTNVPMTSFGHISTWWNIMPGQVSTYGFDADVTNGMSGGGLFDMDGGLVGIIIQKSTVIGSDHRAVRYDEIREVIDDLRSGVMNP